ncbi:MAG: ABC1 kinase family protein [Actinomycetota bacterium]
MEGVRRWVRALFRFLHIWFTVARHAAAAAGERIAGRREVLAPRFRRALEDLGAGFIKVGQLLSTRADLLPDAYRAELVKLREAARPVPYRKIARQLQGAEGAVASFSREPVAAASVSQVHEAALQDGRRVAVKVLRPGIVALVQADVALLALAAWVTERLWRSTRLFDPSGTVAEVGALLRREVDFLAEAEHARAIREVFAGDPTVVVPEIVSATPTVIVMDFVEGVSLADPKALETAGYSRTRYAASVIRANLAMVLGTSVFHADLHPGNLLALPGKLGLLDFGATGDASSEALSAAVNAVMDAVFAGDPEALTDGVLMMSTPAGDLDRTTLSKDLDVSLLRPLSSESLGAVQAAQLLRDLVGLLRRHGLRVNPEMTALLRAVVTCESTARELDPALFFRRVVVPFLVTRAMGLPAYVVDDSEG